VIAVARVFVLAAAALEACSGAARPAAGRLPAGRGTPTGLHLFLPAGAPLYAGVHPLGAIAAATRVLRAIDPDGGVVYDMLGPQICAGDPAPFDAREVPGAIFTHPEIASIGIREAEATQEGLPVRIGRFPFAANARATTSGDTVGYVKVVAHAESHEVLGVSIIGPGAADLIATASLAIHLHARLEDLAHTIHVHPTWSEALLEAAWAALDSPVHVPRRRPRVSERTPA